MQRLHVFLGIGLCFFGIAAASAQETNPVRRHPDGAADAAARVIVKLKAAGNTGRVQALAAEDRVAALAARSGVGIRGERRLGSRLHVLELGDAAGVAEQVERLRADASVEYAQIDRRRYAHALPSDPLYTGQWYLKVNDSAKASAIDAETAWDSTTGTTGIVVAVLDTGVRFDHPDLVRADLGGRLLPGYDFVSDAVAANDGGGRDADASDPGDWVTSADVLTPQFRNCTPSASSWHGTRVAGLIGARSNNAEGIAGTTWAPWLLPVRVLGKCGGFDTDILAGMLWAGGVHVDGVPDNAYPARIVNLSLGGEGACEFFYQDVIDELSSRGVTVVISAGNEGGPVDSPANCAGAVAVGGLRHVGTKVGYSSLGPQVTVSAPAGNCVNLSGACLFSIDTTVNQGTTSPAANGYTDQINANIGTSFSSPIVAGIAALMLSVNGNLKPDQVRARLQEGATKPFPISSDTAVPQCHVPTSATDVQGSECNCTTDTCGAGMANARGAVAAARRPIAALAAPSVVSAGQNVALSAAGSAAACGRAIASYEWTIAGGTGSIIGPTNAAATTVIAPSAGQQFTVRVTVTDDAGRTDFADVIVNDTLASTTAPSAAGATPCLASIAAPTPTVTVAVTPATATVQIGQTQAFAATVANTANTAVTWSVDGVVGGSTTLGTVSAAGVYTAPATVGTLSGVTVTAAWSGDATITASARVTLTPVAAQPTGSSGGGGGGSLALEVALLALAAALRARRGPRRALAFP